METFDLIGEIDEAGIAEVEALVGQPIRVEQWNREASLDSIRHYALGLGDDNPLFCDTDYAERTPYGDVIAPPTFPFTAFDGAIGAGLPGVQPMYAGTSWRFHRRIPRNAPLVASASFGPVRRTRGSMTSDMVIQTAEVTYTDGGGTIWAEATAQTFRVPRRKSSSGLSYEERQEHQHSPKELADIMNEAVNEYRRGREPLDAIAPGSSIPRVVKGPIGRIDMTAYYAGLPGSPGYKSVEMAWKYRYFARHEPERLPTNYDPSYFAERVLPSIGHQDAKAARELGMPNAYNNGPQRVGWFAHCVTNWMGDGAFLAALDVRIRRPEIFGDVIRIGGTVTDVTSDETGSARYSIALESVNQHGEVTGTATAEVVDDEYGRGTS